MTTALLRSSTMRWAAGGWLFFIAENVVLSENRTMLIENLGDGGYHSVYGFFSTVATGSIVYAYIRKVRHVGPFAFTGLTPLPWRIASWALLSVGLGMASQTLPKFQIPVAYTAETTTDNTVIAAAEGPAPVAAAKPSFQVRCPFDFAAKKQPGVEMYGMERVSRHPGLWSMAFVGLGHACLVASLPQRVWLCMPTLLAWIGGSHTDSRFRRGMGGTLEPEYDNKTSNIPFAAMLTAGGWEELAKEIKPLNGLMAAGVAAIWAFRRGQVPASVRKAAESAIKR
jgi:uncharacterized membrane protein